MSNIWHTVDETPKPYEDVAFYVDGYLYSSYYEPQHNQYGIFGADKVEKWCYSKDLSSYILALETDLDRTRKALGVAVDALKRIDETRSGIKENLHATNGRALNAGNGFCWATIDDIHNALDKITALEQKDVK